MSGEEFGYSKKSFMVNIAFIGILIVSSISIILMTGMELLYSVLIIVIEVVALVVLGLSPLLTNHEVREGVLVIRQGWYFHARIPLSDIKGITRLDRGPRRTGVFFQLLSSTIFVTSRRNDLIELELNKKQPFGWALGKRANRVVFDTERTERMLTVLGSSLSPVQSQSP